MEIVLVFPCMIFIPFGLRRTDMIPWVICASQNIKIFAKEHFVTTFFLRRSGVRANGGGVQVCTTGLQGRGGRRGLISAARGFNGR